MIELLSIEEACALGLRGFKKIFLILPEDVQAEIRRPQCCIPMTSMPTLIDGKAMYQIGYDRNTARFLEKKNIANRAGDYFDNSLTFTVKKTRIELDTLSTLLMNRKIHALLIDKENKVKYVKNLRCDDEADSGDKANRNEYRFRFTSKSIRKAPSVSGVLPPFIGYTPSPSGGTNNGDCMIIGTDELGFRWCVTINSVGDLVCTRL